VRGKLGHAGNVERRSLESAPPGAQAPRPHPPVPQNVRPPVGAEINPTGLRVCDCDLLTRPPVLIVPSVPLRRHLPTSPSVLQKLPEERDYRSAPMKSGVHGYVGPGMAYKRLITSQERRGCLTAICFRECFHEVLTRSGCRSGLAGDATAIGTHVSGNIRSLRKLPSRNHVS